MSIKSLIDSIYPLVEIRAKSKLNSMREQILWKNYCQLILNQKQSVCQQKNNSFNENKTNICEENNNNLINNNNNNNLINNNNNNENDIQIPTELMPKICFLQKALKNSESLENKLKSVEKSFQKPINKTNNKLIKNNNKNFCVNNNSINDKTSDESIDEFINELINLFIIEIFEIEIENELKLNSEKF